MDDQNQPTPPSPSTPPPPPSPQPPSSEPEVSPPEAPKPDTNLYSPDPGPPFPISIDPKPTPPEPSSPETDDQPYSAPVSPVGGEAEPPPFDSPEAASPPGEPAQIVEPLFKRLIPILIGLIVIVAIFLLVTKLILPKFSKPKEPQSISLKYWGLWEPETITAQIIKDYQLKNPHVTIQYTRQSHKDYRERLQSSLATGEGPDIFRFHNTWLPMLKSDLAPVPEDTYSQNQFDTTFYPVAKKDVFSTGRYYGIPLEFDALALYVNQDVFTNNPNLTIPTTWDNLRETAFKLTTKDGQGNITRAGVALGTTENIDNFSDILGLMILQNGGNPGKPDSEAVTSAMKFYTLFATQDKSWSSTLPNSTYAFATNKAAMIIAPSWRALEVSQLNPQLNFKLYPVPQLPGTNVAWATYWIEGVSKKSPNQQAAFDFVKYLSSADVLKKMYSSAAQTRLFGEPYSRQDMATSLQNDPYLGAIVSQAISAQSWPLASRTFDNGLNDKLIKYYQDAINSYLKQEAEKNITTNLTQGVSQILNQYGLAN